jgi:hypothetical protein
MYIKQIKYCILQKFPNIMISQCKVEKMAKIKVVV